MRPFFTPRLLVALAAATLLVLPEAHAQRDGRDVLTDDPADLEHLTATTFDHPDLSWFYFDAVWSHEGVVYGGEGLIDNAGCIPGMDSATFDGDPFTTCGGANFYLAHDGLRTLSPLVGADQVGFWYGTSDDELLIEVRLSDGSMREFVMAGGAEEGAGTAGYFGYDTGDAALFIDEVAIVSSDGGIDDVAFGLSYLEDAYQNVVLTGATCSLEGLAVALEQTPMEAALAARLQRDMAQILTWYAQGDTERVTRGLQTLAYFVELERGERIEVLAADDLLDCIDALVLAE